MNIRTKNRGFTLIEVVVALAILSIGLVVIIELFSGGLRLGRTSMEYTKAINYARFRMEEISVKTNIAEGTEEGRFTDNYRWKTWVKRVQLLPLDKNSDIRPPVELYQVKINILWNSGSKERSVGIESYKAVKRGEDEKKS
jgi:general secretion pathway protein I